MTNSYYEIAQETGYEELNFPPQPELQTPKYEFGPTTIPYSSNNGLTYVYDPDKAAWTLLKGDTASQAWVNSQLTYKLDKAGGSVMGPDGLKFKPKADAATEEVIKIGTDGHITFYGVSGVESAIVFNNIGISDSRAGIIRCNDNVNFKFTETSTTAVQTLIFSTSLISSNSALIKHNDTSTADVTLIDCGGGAGGTTNLIRISQDGALTIGTSSTPYLKVEGRGKVTASSRFVVTNIVDMKEGYMHVSDDYQDALIQDTTDDNVVASVGYVRQGAFKPGMRVFAENEGDAEVGGLWTSNKRYYIRVS